MKLFSTLYVPIERHRGLTGWRPASPEARVVFKRKCLWFQYFDLISLQAGILQSAGEVLFDTSGSQRRREEQLINMPVNEARRQIANSGPEGRKNAVAELRRQKKKAARKKNERRLARLTTSVPHKPLPLVMKFGDEIVADRRKWLEEA